MPYQRFSRKPEKFRRACSQGYAAAFFLWVIKETIINVMKPKGIEMMPGFCKGMGASCGFSP